MNRLHREFRRLFLCSAVATPDGAGHESDRADADGRVRALVLEVARPAHWQPLAAVWKGVQADYGLPAPAIAVNGSDGLQLWFSLAEPLDPVQAQAFLQGLRLRYLADLSRDRVGCWPEVASATMQTGARLAPVVPAAQAASGRWSAFVAPDLAAMFEEEPWLDLHPGDDGQAELLARLASIPPALFAAALDGLQAHAAAATGAAAGLTTAGPAVAAAAAAAGARAGGDLARNTHRPAAAHADAQRFLLTVMNDAAAPLALRVEAAKALLPFGPRD